MDKFKNFIFILFILLIGIYIGTYVYRYKNIKLKDVFLNDYKIYLLQYGVYKEKDSMLEAGKNIENYFYYNDKDGYHIIIGITLDKKLTNKIKNSFNVDEVYEKEKNVGNTEFIENLKQYDLLISSTESEDAIMEAEKQVLNKYEELVLNNE